MSHQAAPPVSTWIDSSHSTKPMPYCAPLFRRHGALGVRSPYASVLPERLDEPDYWHRPRRNAEARRPSRDALAPEFNRPGSRQIAVIGSVSEQTREVFSSAGALLIPDKRSPAELIAARDRYVFGVLACESDWSAVMHACIAARKRCFALPPGTDASAVNVSRFLATATPEDFYMITADARKILDTVQWDYYHSPAIKQHTVSVVLPNGKQRFFSSDDGDKALNEAAAWLTLERGAGEPHASPNVPRLLAGNAEYAQASGAQHGPAVIEPRERYRLR